MKYSMHEKWNMKRIETRESWVIDFFYARIPKLKKKSCAGRVDQRAERQTDLLSEMWPI